MITKKKILILEDDAIRQKEFRVNLVRHDICIVDSASDAIEKLVGQQWDVLMLDHDLGGKVGVPSGANTGYEVAKSLEMNTKYKPKLIVIHSMNVVGAELMRLALPEAIYMPCGWLQKNLELLGIV